MYLHSFQYKILNNFLFLNKKLLVFRIKNTPLCSSYNKKDETPLHIFSEYTSVIYLWQHLATFFENNLILPALTPQTALFKLHVYNSREKHRLNIIDLLTDIKEIKKTKYRLSSNSEKKKDISK